MILLIIPEQVFGYYQVDSQRLGEILLQDVVLALSAGTPESAINAPASAVIRNNFLSTASFYVESSNIRINKIAGGSQSFDDINSGSLFTDFTNGDFTLASDSPCIDKGPDAIQGPRWLP